MELILASEFPVSFPKTRQLLGDGVRGKKAVFIPTAAYGEGFEPDYELYGKPFEDMGVSITSFDLRGKREEEVQDALSDAAIVSVCGGNTFYLLKHMRESGFNSVMRRCLDRGVVYIGSSAGSIVCSPDISFIDVMDDPLSVSLENTKGLHLIDYLFLPHLDHAFLKEKAMKRIASYKGDTPLIALRDDQLLYVRDKVTRIL